MDTTYKNPNENFFSYGQGGNLILPKAPSVPVTMDASGIQSTPTGLNLAAPATVAVPNIANLSSAESTPQPVVPIAPPTAPNLFQRITGGVTDLFSSSKNKEQDLQARIDTETTPYTQQLNELNTQIRTQQANAIANQEKALRSGETTGFASREAQNIARTDAIEALKLSALAEGMRGNIALAEQHATNAINAKYADIDRRIEEAKTNIYDNYDSFTPTEKKKADATLLRLDKDDAFVKLQKEDDKIIQGFLQEAIAQSAKNGKPVDGLTLKRANDAQTPTEALQILAPFMIDADAKAEALLDRQVKQAQLSKLNADIRATNIGSGLTSSGSIPAVTNPEAGKYAGALQVILGSGKFTKDQKADVVNAVNNGQDPFAVVKNQAKNIMGQTLATDLDKAETAKQQLESIDASLKEFYANNGQTGIFTGNYEKTLNNLGKVKDPKLVGLATEIALAMQAYRLAVTGTAASVQEDARIDNVFPGITSGEVLNNARTKATIKSFDNKIDAAYRNTLGSVYDSLKGAQNTPSQTTKGVLSNSEFVNQALSKQKVSYTDAVKSIPAGYIGAVDNSTGQLVQMLPTDFDPAKYTKL